MNLSPTHTLAAAALVNYLGYQSGLAYDETCSMPDDVAADIVAIAEDRTNPQQAQCLRDILSRLYDQRREGHRRAAAEEMAYQQQVIAARVVLENQLGHTTADSVQLTAAMTPEELTHCGSITPGPDAATAAQTLLAAMDQRLTEAIQAAALPEAEPAQEATPADATPTPAAEATPAEAAPAAEAATPEEEPAAKKAKKTKATEAAPAAPTE